MFCSLKSWENFVKEYKVELEQLKKSTNPKDYVALSSNHQDQLIEKCQKKRKDLESNILNRLILEQLRSLENQKGPTMISAIKNVLEQIEARRSEGSLFWPTQKEVVENKITAPDMAEVRAKLRELGYRVNYSEPIIWVNGYSNYGLKIEWAAIPTDKPPTKEWNIQASVDSIINCLKLSPKITWPSQEYANEQSLKITDINAMKYKFNELGYWTEFTEPIIKVSGDITSKSVTIKAASPSTLPPNDDGFAKVIKELETTLQWNEYTVFDREEYSKEVFQKVGDYFRGHGYDVGFYQESMRITAPKTAASPSTITPVAADGLPGIAIKGPLKESIGKVEVAPLDFLAPSKKHAQTEAKRQIGFIDRVLDREYSLEAAPSVYWLFADGPQHNTPEIRAAIIKHYKDRGYSIVTNLTNTLTITKAEPFEKTIERIDVGFKNNDSLSWSITHVENRQKVAAHYIALGFDVKEVTHNLKITKPLERSTNKCECAFCTAYENTKLGKKGSVIHPPGAIFKNCTMTTGDSLKPAKKLATTKLEKLYYALGLGWLFPSVKSTKRHI